MIKPRLLAAALALMLAGAQATEIKLFGRAEAIDPAEVARILGRHAPLAYAAGAPLKMRSIRLLDAAATAAPAALAEGEPATGEAPAALALPVQFAFDSAEIQPAARSQLDAIAAGIRLLPPAQAVLIEGHTDARGAQEYNEALSLRRAQAVRRYLVAAHAIEPARLRAVGLGEHVALPGVDPLAAENRRVQFRGE